MILKLASMGDLIHLLPALTDAKQAIADIGFDWIVDKRFADIPFFHPAVCNTIETDHRTWRSSPFSKKTRSEFSNLLNRLKKNRYETIIDAQGNLKTGILSCFTKGEKAGFDGNSIQEWGTHFFYDKKIASSKKMHAVFRLRQLFAKSLEYPLPTTPPDYGIDTNKLTPPLLSLPSSYLIFVPIASYASKLWSNESWSNLIRLTVNAGKHVLLPWGNETERKRAESLAVYPNVTVLPRLSLREIGYLILHAEGVVSVDTGLSHMAAALDTPCITLYGPTDPSLIGTVGKNQIHITTPCRCLGKKQCNRTINSHCLSSVSPMEVFEKLEELLS